MQLAVPPRLATEPRPRRPRPVLVLARVPEPLPGLRPRPQLPPPRHLLLRPLPQPAVRELPVASAPSSAALPEELEELEERLAAQAALVRCLVA